MRHMTAVVVIVALALGMGAAACSSTDSGAVAVADEGQWVKVATMKTNSETNGPPFALEGGRQQLRWNLRPEYGSQSMFAYVMPVGQDIVQDGGVYDAETGNPGAGVCDLYKDAGEYYFHIAAVGKLTIEMWEMR